MQQELKIPKGRKEGITLTFQALLYADDTLLCEDNERRMEILLWAIEQASEAFGLNFNKEKCQQLSAGETTDIYFLDNSKVPRASIAECLGELLHEKTDPRCEIFKRISKAAYGRLKLNTFWRRANLTRKHINLRSAD